jgi:hypothetical protein
MKLWQRLRIEPFLIWDKLMNNKEFPDDVKEAIETNKPLGGTVSQNKMKNTKFRVETFVVTENPNISCDF